MKNTKGDIYSGFFNSTTPNTDNKKEINLSFQKEISNENLKGKLEKKQKIITKKSTTKSFKQEKQFITPPSNINNDLNQAEITENIQSKTTTTKNSLKTNEIKEFQIIKKENRQKLAPNQSTNKKEKVSEEPKLSDFVLELFILFIPLIYSLAKYNYKPIKCNRSKLDNRQSIVILSKEQFLLCNEK